MKPLAFIALSLAFFAAPGLAAQDPERSIVVTLDVGIEAAFDSVYAAAVTLGQVVTYTDGARVITIGPTDRFKNGNWDRRATFTANLVATNPDRTLAVFSATLIAGEQSASLREIGTQPAKDTGGWGGNAVAWLKSWAEAAL